jgi:hypothetical protein
MEENTVSKYKVSSENLRAATEGELILSHELKKR